MVPDLRNARDVCNVLKYENALLIDRINSFKKDLCETKILYNEFTNERLKSIVGISRLNWSKLVAYTSHAYVSKNKDHVAKLVKLGILRLKTCLD